MIVHSIQSSFLPVFLQPSTLANSFSRIELTSTILQLHTYSYKPSYFKKQLNRQIIISLARSKETNIKRDEHFPDAVYYQCLVIAHTLITYATGPCSLSAEPGPCRGACPRFYYDASRNSCRPFTYGCCGGNANNFKSKKLCERSCRPRRKFNYIFYSF